MRKLFMSFEVISPPTAALDLPVADLDDCTFPESSNVSAGVVAGEDELGTSDGSFFEPVAAVRPVLPWEAAAAADQAAVADSRSGLALKYRRPVRLEGDEAVNEVG